MLLERGLIESEQIELSEKAQVEAKEANLKQLQKELDQHNEKATRVNRQIARLDKEVGSKCGSEAEYFRSDIQLKSLREISRETLKTIAKIKDAQPQMSYEIEQTVQNVGLRLPTPSPLQSPASSARLSSRSSTSSRSLLSHRSTSSKSSNEERIATSTG